MKNHEYDSNRIRQALFVGNIDSVPDDVIRDVLTRNIMNYKTNEKVILANDMAKVRETLRFIRDMHPNDFDASYKRLLTDLKIDGSGPSVISQILAAAHPTEYAVYHENIVHTLKELKIINEPINGNTAKGYAYINKVCKDLYKRKLEPKLKDSGFDFSLWAVHNFLFHYWEAYQLEGTWWKSTWKNTTLKT